MRTKGWGDKGGIGKGKTTVLQPAFTLQTGFALASILWLLAGLVILVSGATVSLLGVARTQADMAQRLTHKLAEQRAMADISFLYTTQASLGAGLVIDSKLLMLDESVGYQVDSKVVGFAQQKTKEITAIPGETLVFVQLQDESGLLGLNSANHDMLVNLLAQCQATRQEQLSLPDALLDYTDQDGLKRINGAEAFEYAAAGKAPPPNRFLQHPHELWQVLGWDSIRQRWQAGRCDQAVSLRTNSRLNLYTSPPSVLRAAGLTPEQALIATRDRFAARNRPVLAPYLLNLIDQKYGLEGLMRFDNRSVGSVRATVLSSDKQWAASYQIERLQANTARPFSVKRLSSGATPSDASLSFMPKREDSGANGAPVMDNLWRFVLNASTTSNATRPVTPFN